MVDPCAGIGASKESVRAETQTWEHPSVSDRWRIEPEPTEEELAALTVAILSATGGQSMPEPDIGPVSAWLNAARREAIETRIGDGAPWRDRS